MRSFSPAVAIARWLYALWLPWHLRIIGRIGHVALSLGRVVLIHVQQRLQRMGDVIDRAGFWDQTLSLGDDGEYFTRVILNSRRVLFCSGARCYYRSGVQGSLSGNKSLEGFRSAFRVIDLCESHVLARENSERMKRASALMWQHLSHAAYPYDPVIAERALERARRIHTVTITPGGGPTFRLVSRVIGWRAARKLQVLSGRP